MLALAALGCGSEPTYVEYAEVCGEAGPVRVLELARGERLSRRPMQVGERVVFSVGRGAAGESGEAAPQTSATSTVWTTGLCGEAPRRIAEEVDSVFSIAQWPGVLLACDADVGEVLVLDPEGVLPPQVLLGDLEGCGVRWTAQGLIGLLKKAATEGEAADAGLGTLLLYPLPADPRSGTIVPVTLLDAVRIRGRENEVTGVFLSAFEEFVLAVTPEDELVRIDLADKAVSSVQTGVAGFLADGQGRYLLWQDQTPTDDHPSFPAGKVFLRDRNDSTDVFLGQTTVAYNASAMRFIEGGALLLELPAIRVFSVPDMGFRDLPDLGRVTARLDEGRWLMAGKGMLNVVELASGEATELYRGSGDILRVLGDRVELLQVPPCCERSTLRAEGPLWSVSYEGEVRRLVARASRYGHSFKDGRRVVVVDIGGDWRGTLQLTDPETQEALRIDGGVFAQSFVAPQVYGADVLVYSIPEGARAGVWIARMPAAPASEDMKD